MGTNIPNHELFTKWEALRIGHTSYCDRSNYIYKLSILKSCYLLVYIHQSAKAFWKDIYFLFVEKL